MTEKEQRQWTEKVLAEFFPTPPTQAANSGAEATSHK
jgi:hypothetical protein